MSQPASAAAWAGEAGHDSLASRPSPVRERIAILDVLRGLAILSILFLNIGLMSAPRGELFGDGWSVWDYRVFGVIHVLMDGTERGLLELLFGAGAMILTARAMKPDAPVAVADLFYRRNLWLLGFGLFDVFALLWIGDILFFYGLAALFLFPFRRLAPRWLLVIGLVWTLWSAFDGAKTYAERAALEQRVAAGDTAARTEWRALTGVEAFRSRAREKVAAEVKAREGGVATYAYDHWKAWHAFALEGTTLLDTVFEAASTMLIGMALWSWGVTTGGRSRRFYGVAMVLGYAVGVGARVVGLPALLSHDPRPQSIWITEEAARLAVTLGHLSLVNLLWTVRPGRAVLAPFKAAGRVAFSIYLLQSLIAGWWLFAPWGPGLWGRYDWAGMAGIAAAETAALLMAANLWLRVFAIGPMEWAWRSLSYGAVQPWRARASAILT